jgi:hypothetical protein
MTDTFSKACLAIGIDGAALISGYLANDPRADEESSNVFRRSVDNALNSNDPETIKQLFESISHFFSNPNDEEMWKYALLIKHLSDHADENDCSWSVEENHWVELEKFGGSLDQICNNIKKINNDLVKKVISPEQYDNKLLSALAAFLAIGLTDDASTNVKSLLTLVSQNTPIMGAFISEDSPFGWGEIAANVRRMLEELTGIRIDVPEGVDPEEDEYFDNIDWDEVADEIVTTLG